MTVWILLTLALGAITGTADAPLLRTQCASSVAQSRVQIERRVTRCISPSDRRDRSNAVPRRSTVRSGIGVEVPLTGSAAPRAPAPNC